MIEGFPMMLLPCSPHQMERHPNLAFQDFVLLPARSLVHFPSFCYLHKILRNNFHIRVLSGVVHQKAILSIYLFP